MIRKGSVRCLHHFALLVVYELRLSFDAELRVLANEV
jgi:hypothetical protein